ncbi:NUDIX hydrolase [Hyphomicrobium sp. CS1GBMeth3]|uniref:NUDIX hydrolase n=1 Tax=Hyphomicrobium sp. CS1GBMeth3 TaxID=1892845 RepID=UPI0009303AA2|nr:NUDIX hydrolase [Hyphomicrobium sp. CS1GBMeth3]
MWRPDETRVFTATALDLRLSDERWPFADQHKDEIAAHWDRRVRQSPAFFNGPVLVLADYALAEDGVLRGRFLRSDFRSFLYWRETGLRDASVMDAFGCGLILSAEGSVLLGRQRAGNLNGGLCYPPAGFVDDSDVAADGSVDIEASAAREIVEETGLTAPTIERAGGYVITVAGPVLSIAVTFRSELPGAKLLLEAQRHIASDADSEIAAFLLAVPGSTLDDVPMPPYARALVTHLQV